MVQSYNFKLAIVTLVLVGSTLIVMGSVVAPLIEEASRQAAQNIMDAGR